MSTSLRLSKSFCVVSLVLSITLLVSAFMALGGIRHDQSARRVLMERAYADALARLAPALSAVFSGPREIVEQALRGSLADGKEEYVILSNVRGEPLISLFSSRITPEQAAKVIQMLRGHINFSLLETGPELGPQMLSTARGFGPNAEYTLTVGVADPIPRTTFFTIYPHNLLIAVILTLAVCTAVMAVRPLRRAAFRMGSALVEGTHEAIFTAGTAGGTGNGARLLLEAASRQMQMREGPEETFQKQNAELKRINTQLLIENSARNAVVQALRRAESRYRDIFDNATEGIFQWTPCWKLLTANMSFASMLGYDTVNFLLHSFAEMPFRFCHSDQVGKDLKAQLEEKGHVTDFEFQVLRQDGSPLWASMNARRVVGHGGVTAYYEAFIENIAVRKSTEEKLVFQAFHDPLTGLANRALFLDRLHMAIRRASRQPGYAFAVLYLDLDRFKMVNDSFGHGTGDDVLCNAADKIVSCVREVDTVARFGGDEFAVLIENTERPAFAVRVAKRVYKTLSEPILIDNQEIHIGASVGIVLNAQKYEQPEDILRDADTAMYHAKAGQDTFMRVFSQKMRVDTLASIALEVDLRQGVKNDEFFMEYQPIVHMDGGGLHGFEALIRWNRREQVVGPGEFIPLAEETGLIKGLGLYTIERVCRRIVQWSATCPRPFVMHVNISGRQLLFPSFPREVQRILEDTGVNPDYLRFEITESVLLDNGRACVLSIQQIRELGVRFCLDDFGTGFSSLSYLRRLPLDSVKLDRSFVAEIENDALSVAIVRNLVCLGKDLGLSVVVEGIERASQVETLAEAGCTLAQGYYFHRPLASEVAAGLLTRREAEPYLRIA